MDLNYEPSCAIPACENKACLSLASRYCWAHTPSGKTPEEFLEELEQLVEGQ